MPRYDYQCDECGHTEEVVQSMSDNHIADCPKCGKPWRRLISRGIMALVNNGPRTLGTLAEKNSTDRQKCGHGIPDTFKHKAPEVPWRKSGKVDRRVLKNPGKYIRTGRID